MKDYLLLIYHLSWFQCLKIIYTVYNSVFIVIQSIISFALYTYLSNNFLSEWNTSGSEWCFVNVSKELYCPNTIFAFFKRKRLFAWKKDFSHSENCYILFFGISFSGHLYKWTKHSSFFLGKPCLPKICNSYVGCTFLAMLG